MIYQFGISGQNVVAAWQNKLFPGILSVSWNWILDYICKNSCGGGGMDSVDEHADAVTDVTDADAVTLLRQFLAINTSHPSPDYQVTPLTVDGIQLFFSGVNPLAGAASG